MRSKKLTLVINKPANEIFDFALDPKNTSLWVNSIVQEETNESPTRLGTIYKNQNPTGEWSEYEITAFEQGRMFVMSQKNGRYHVKYTLTPLGKEQTKLEYHEWVDEGELDELFSLEMLQKLKEIMEKK